MDSLQERVKSLFKTDSSYARWCMSRLSELLEGFFGTGEETDGHRSYCDSVSGRSYTLSCCRENGSDAILLTGDGTEVLRLICGSVPNCVLLNGEEVAFSPKSEDAVLALLEKRLFAGQYAYVPPEPVQADVDSGDFFRQNVLVGALRSREQLTASLKHLQYHIPADAPVDGEKAEYVAPVQSGNGIRYYGKVTAVQRVRRCDIDYMPKSGDREYWLYRVEGWHSLPLPLIADEPGFVAGMTGLTRLKNSRYLSQLFVEDRATFLLYAGIDAYLSGPLVNRQGLVYRFPNRNSVIALEDGHIRVYKKGAAVLNFEPEDFLASPALFFRRFRERQ